MASPYIRVRVLGSLPGGEQWSVNPSLGGNFDTTPVSSAELQAIADGVAALNGGNVLPATLRGLLSNTAYVTAIRAEYYAAGEELSDVREHVLTAPASGLNNATKPYQTSLVSSLLSGIPGRSYRGRLYWPAMGAVIDPNTLRLLTPTAAAVATDVADWLSDVADTGVGGTALIPIVYSKTRGAQVAISQVRVGDVLDTQRRRRDSLTETYAVAAL